jgi:hypothetical protein
VGSRANPPYETTDTPQIMKLTSWSSLLLIPTFILAGCAPVSPTVQPTQEVQLPSPTNLPATVIVAPTATPTLVVTEIPLPIATETLLPTLRPESVKETMQPLIQDPFNCSAPCFLGITPGKTGMDEVRAFFTPLGFKHREGTDPNSGRDFYSVAYESGIGRDSYIVLFKSNNLVENIEIRPEIIKQKNGSPREWTTYSPETLIKKYGKPSRVEFALGLGQVNITINMILYFDPIDLMAFYRGYEHPRSSQFCPFTFPFDYVSISMGPNPPDSPQFTTIPLEKATSLTVDQFTQLMLGDPQKACFNLDNKVFQ